MSSIFTQIREKAVPGHVLYEDAQAFSILTIGPHAPGHLLVIPVEEYVDILSVPEETYVHMFKIAKAMMMATKALYNPPRVALLVAGLEVEHAHIHVFSLFQNEALDHDAILTVTPADLLSEATKIKAYIDEHPLI